MWGNIQEQYTRLEQVSCISKVIDLAVQMCMCLFKVPITLKYTSEFPNTL